MKDSLQTFAENVSAAWGPLTSELVLECRRQLEGLLKASPSEPWLSALHANSPPNAELYRDPHHGFLLLAHAEQAGLYRPPHDHGRSWVIYAMQSGEIEMGTYANVTDAEGGSRLVKRDSTRVCAGQVQVYLPGDIHDTRCITGSALVYRFTERDLRIEDRQARRVTRYVECDGVWIPQRP